ncbi:type II secretion system minor pseudopilin GspK [bacterium]|nr:type II secretion system minor pseudopilin GspK [bacterium]
MVRRIIAWRAALARAARRKLPARGRERGIALLATMLATALMTILVVDFTTTSSLSYRAAANQANELRAACLARSGIAVGLAMLERDSMLDATQQQPFDSLNDIWAIPTPPVPVGGGTAGVVVIDEARKLDINLLYNARTGMVDPNYAQIIARLFEMIGVSTDLIPVIVDWLDPDGVVSPGGAEADYYLRLIPPYEPRNGPMPTIGDLRALKGVNDATFMLLANYLTTTPEMRVNANTASPEVLAALTPEMSNNPSLVKEIVAARQVRPFMQITDIANLPGVGQFAQNLTPLLTTRSSYFTIIGEGEYAGARRRVYATVRRNTNGTAMLISWHGD